MTVFEEKESTGQINALLCKTLYFARKGYEVVVHYTDRLAHNLMDFKSTTQGLNDKGVTIQLLSESLSFSADGRCTSQTLQLQRLVASSQFERTMIRKRQAEGIAKAKSKGIYAHRKRTFNLERVKQLFEDGMSKAAIATHFNIPRMFVYRSLLA